MADIVDGANFDVIVIGGGAAGLVSSGFVSALGLKVALVSDGHPGGECLWTGCVPSKALIHWAKTTSIQNKALQSTSQESFLSALSHMKQAREKISHHDSIETIEKNSGVKVLTGRASFLDNRSVKVGEATLYASRFIIATGGFQAIPQIEGFDSIDCLTHESILELKRLPESICIIGAGPVGVEYAQTLRRLGARVFMVEYSERILPREEPEVSSLAQEILTREGIEIYTSHGAISAKEGDDGALNHILIKDKTNQKELTLKTEATLVATGKTPSTKGLGLENAGVARDQRGFITTDLSQRTNVSNIWACGDICGKHQFTHYADHTAQIAALSSSYPPLSFLFKAEQEVIPWCTFMDPEIASVGLRKEEAIKRHGHKNVFVLKYSLTDFDRAIVDDNAVGFMQAIISKDGRILGATIVGKSAGEVIHEFAIAMKNKISIQQLSQTIHVYPTMAQAIRNLSAQYYKQIKAGSPQLAFARALASWLK